MKNIFLKSTIYLMIGTIITKILGFLIKIIATRNLGDAYFIYSLILPTYSLLISVTQLNLPIAISSIVSKSKHKSIEVLASIIPITLIFNALIMILVFFFAPYISNNLLNNPDAYYPILAIIPIIPFTTLSGIIKGYYFGKQNMLPNVISNTIEQIVRLILTIILIPIIVKFNPIMAVVIYVLINAITEIVQIIIYLLFMPKNINIKLSDLKPKISIMNEILSISLPSLGSRLIGNISYFFEPIILSNILIFVGYSSEFITKQYGIYNAYVIPMLTIFSFITLALNTTIIPEISKNINHRDIIKKRLKLILSISLLLGIITSLINYFYGSHLLKLIYNTTEGIDYLKTLSIFFAIFYLEGPLASTLIALKESFYTMIVTIISCIVKLLVLTILSFFSIGIYGLIISEIVNIYLVVYLNMKKLKKMDYI